MRPLSKSLFFLICIVLFTGSLWAQSTITLGTGTSFTNPSDPSPINIHYRSLRGQMVVRADELMDAGISGPSLLTRIGFYIHQAPLYPLPLFKIRMAHAWNDDATNHYSGPLETVYSNDLYYPQAGGYDMLSLSHSFKWDGISSILVDISFNLAEASDDSGSVQYTEQVNGFRYVGSNTTYQAYSTTSTVLNYRPNIRLSFSPYSQFGWSGMSQEMPFGTSTNRYQASAAIYKPTELGGFDTITHLGWNVITSTYVNLPIKIYLKTSTLSYFNSSSRNWYDLKNGATEVYNGTVNFGHTGWIDLDITDFDYSQDNLLVLCESLLGNTLSAASAPQFGFTYSNLIAPTNNKHIWFNAGSLSGGNPAYSIGTYNDQVPNIIVGGLVAFPTSFTASSVSYHQIDLSWVDNYLENEVLIAANTSDSFGSPVTGQYYDVGDNLPGGGSIIYRGTAQSYSHTDIEPDTTYYYRAYSHTFGYYSDGQAAFATTDPAPLTDFPILIDFETGSYPPDDWTTDGPSNFWNLSNSVGAYGQSTYSINSSPMMWDGTPEAGLVSPQLDLSGLSHPSFSFDYSFAAPGYGETILQIQSSDDNGLSYTTLTSLGGTSGGLLDTGAPSLMRELPGQGQWATYQLAVPPSANRLRIVTLPDTGPEFYLDNLSIFDAPIGPGFQLSPSNKHFGDLQIESSSFTQNFAITNPGTQAVNITNISFDQNPASQFELGSLPALPALVAPGETLSFTIVVSASTTGLHQAILRISTDSPGLDDYLADIYVNGIDEAYRNLPYVQTWDLWDSEAESSSMGWQAFNQNLDGYIWGLWYNYENYQIEAKINSYFNQALDDWFISGPIELHQGITYSISYDYRRADYTTQMMKLAVGRQQSPDAMLNVLADHPLITNTDYQTNTVEFSPTQTGLYYFGFHAYSAAQPVMQGRLYLDNIYILPPNSQIVQVVPSGGSLSLDFDPISIGGQEISPSIFIDGFSGSPTINVAVASSPSWALASAGLCFRIEGSGLDGITIQVTHNLGFIPSHIAVQIGSGGLQIIENPGDWTDTTISFEVDMAKGLPDIKLQFPLTDSSTLPIQLSSFTAILSGESEVRINWVVESETSHQGYNILRSEILNLGTAYHLNPDLISEGVANGSQISYLFVDNQTEPGATYYYWLESLDTTGGVSYYGPLELSIPIGPSDPGTPPITYQTELLNAYPNPFNPSTAIFYSLEKAAELRLDIYNLRGQIVRSFGRSHASGGKYSLIWDGRDESGREVSSGVYVYRMTTPGYDHSRKVILLK